MDEIDCLATLPPSLASFALASFPVVVDLSGNGERLGHIGDGVVLHLEKRDLAQLVHGKGRWRKEADGRHGASSAKWEERRAKERTD